MWLQKLTSYGSAEGAAKLIAAIRRWGAARFVCSRSIPRGGESDPPSGWVGVGCCGQPVSKPGMCGSPRDPTPSSRRCTEARSRTGDARRPAARAKRSVLEGAKYVADPLAITELLDASHCGDGRAGYVDFGPADFGR